MKFRKFATLCALVAELVACGNGNKKIAQRFYGETHELTTRWYPPESFCYAIERDYGDGKIREIRINNQGDKIIDFILQFKYEIPHRDYPTHIFIRKEPKWELFRVYELTDANSEEKYREQLKKVFSENGFDTRVIDWLDIDGKHPG